MAIASEKPKIEPVSGLVNEEKRRLAEQVRTQRARRIQALNLQRENILSQRTSNASRRAALESALKGIEAEIAKLD